MTTMTGQVLKERETASIKVKQAAKAAQEAKAQAERQAEEQKQAASEATGTAAESVAVQSSTLGSPPSPAYSRPPYGKCRLVPLKFPIFEPRSASLFNV